MATKKKPQAAKVENLADKKELVEKFREVASTEFARYKSDREDIDEQNQVADAMYTCMQNRALLSSERSRGMDQEHDPRANVGSVIFHSQVNRLAANLSTVVDGRERWWKYKTIQSEGVDTSPSDAEGIADQASALAEWTLKEDKLDERFPQFATHVYKYTTVFAMIDMKRQRATRKFLTPNIKVIGTGENGQPITAIDGEKEVEAEVITKNHPTIVFPHVDMIYADRYIPTIADQNCVIMLSLRNKDAIYDDVYSGYFSEKAYDLIDEQMRWNGTEGSTLKTSESENRETTFSPQGTMQYLQWDVFMRSPIENGNWDDKNIPKLYWGTFIGNTLSEAIPMRIERNPDPDDEIPLKEIKAIPDNIDQLYCTPISSVIRSAYSVDCTLLNIALDNMGAVVDPPLKIIDGMHSVKDFSFIKGQRWHVDDPNAITQMEIRDATQNIAQMRDQVRNEILQALATDPADMGQYAGSRTSAAEFVGVNQNSSKPKTIQARFILNQLCGWMGRKYLSYWRAFGLPEQVVQITDEAKRLYKIQPKEITGEFDVVVNVVDQYEDTLMQDQSVRDFIRMVGESPALQASATHSVDMGNLLRMWLKLKKIDYTSIVGPPAYVDSKKAARSDIDAMLSTGQYIRPEPGTNLAVRLQAFQAERLRWTGLEEAPDPRAANVALLDQHIAELKQMMADQTGNTNMTAPTQNQGDGEMAGNAIAAQMGAALGGQQ